MSKKSDGKQTNTLLNYFASPKAKQTTSTTSKSGVDQDDEPLSQRRKRNAKIDSSSGEDSDTHSSTSKPEKKWKKQGNGEGTQRKRIRKSALSSEDENDEPNTSLAKNQKSKSKKRKIDSDSETSDADVKPSRKTPQSKKPTNGTGPIKTAKTEPKQPVGLPLEESHTNWLHNNLSFLKPDNIRDIKKNRLGDPDYDPRTLYVPPDYLESLTPAMRQWWILKSQHMDCVLFFKVGKFYELYHMDAVVGVQHLGFSYMKGEFAHSGFPESAYAKMSTQLIEKGFKVARVEQTETPEMMAERCRQQQRSTKFCKVVKREICQITTKATCVYNAQVNTARNDGSCYLYAVSVKKNSDNSIRYGVCFVETSIGTIYLSEFDDDKHCSNLLAMFAEYPPGHILTEKKSLVTHFTELLKSSFKEVRKEALTASQFYSAETTLNKLSNGCYFRDKDDKVQWPALFDKIADGCNPKPEHALALKCLGACLWYLQDAQLDIQVLSMKKFELYDPHHLNAKESLKRDYLVLDATTIHNLSLLGGKGTLQKTVDFCQTEFGRRLLQQWICRPLCDMDKIKQRQDAVTELWSNTDLLKNTQNVLKKLPDLERQVTKIHTYGSKFCSMLHPDSRAIFYESKIYSKRKIQDLLKTLKGFEALQELQEIYKDSESSLLRKLTQYSPEGMNIDLKEHLDFFKDAFDQEQAKTEGKIIPQKGVDAEYDRVEAEIEKINKKLDSYLQEQCRFFGCQVTYFGSDKKRYQLEVPDKFTHKVTTAYQLEGAKKGNKPCKRYSTEWTKEMLAAMMKAEAERTKVILDLNRRIFENFSQRRQDWEQVIMCVMILDVLCSFAEYARTYPEELCLPLIEPFSNKPRILIENGRHPCVPNSHSFVANDTIMGMKDYPAILLLTGPNMGGKSTLMRQVALIAIMAQMGSMVPASKCELTLVDRVFTRLGAKDDIVQNRSTFFVELSEASAILNHASVQSLVLIDELGRGTSTHDGNAIATAYVRKLAEIKCRTVFSTHYHSLVDRFVKHDGVQLGHMACMVENDDDPTEESVTFLYKMIKGKCPKSYGFNAARLAGLNSQVVARGRIVARELEEKTRNRDTLLKICSLTNMEDIRRCLMAL